MLDLGTLILILLGLNNRFAVIRKTVVVTGHEFEEDELVDYEYESNFLEERL
jgi:hypothetical protein